MLAEFNQDVSVYIVRTNMRFSSFQRDRGDFPSTHNAQRRTEQEATLAVKFALQP